MYRNESLSKAYDDSKLVNSFFLREKCAGYQFCVKQVYDYFISVFKEFKPSTVADGSLFLFVAIEYYNFTKLKRYEVYEPVNLFNQQISFEDFRFEFLQEEDLKCLANRCHSNWSYFFLSSLLLHLDKIWYLEKAKMYIVRRVQKQLTLKWLEDLEYGLESLNTFVMMNYEWLLINHSKLKTNTWKYLKLEAQKMDYLLDYYMSEPQKVRVRFRDLFDAFRPARRTPSNLQNYLERDLVLKTY